MSNMQEIRRKFGDDDTAEIKIAKRRLQWLGHLARMPDHRLPKVAGSLNPDEGVAQKRGEEMLYGMI